jgi:hypothetical protein
MYGAGTVASGRQGGEVFYVVPRSEDIDLK